jgi:hypothetical protein
VANAKPLEGAQEIQRMLVDYAKQETVDPLKTLGKYLAFGIAGALMVFLGVFFLGLATLRLVQTVDTFKGASWASTVPYLLAVLVLSIAMAIIGLSLNRAKRKVLP